MLKPQIINAIPDIENFLRYCQRQDFKPKAQIIMSGEESHSLFFILDGSVSVIIEGNEDHEMVVSYLNPGDFFGEMGVYEDEITPRSAMVQAKTLCEVAEISYERFHKVRGQFPDVLFAIGKQMSERLPQTTRQELGRIVGCSREMAGRVLKNLDDEGLISAAGKTIVVFGTR